MASETEEASEGTVNGDNVPCRLRRRGRVILNRIGFAFLQRMLSTFLSLKPLKQCCFAGLQIKHRHFLIRLTYTCPISSKTVENSVEECHGCKKRKTGTHYGLDTSDDDIKCSGFLTSEAGALVERPFGSLQANESSMYLKLPLEQTNQPCCLEFLCYRTQIYFGGRYLKYSRNVSQTYWIIDDERMGEASVEEIIGTNILPICCGDNYKFHAAGREDVDVMEIFFTVL